MTHLYVLYVILEHPIYIRSGAEKTKHIDTGLKNIFGQYQKTDIRSLYLKIFLGKESLSHDKNPLNALASS